MEIKKKSLLMSLSSSLYISFDTVLSLKVNESACVEVVELTEEKRTKR